VDLLHLGIEGIGDDKGVEVATAGEVDGGGNGEGAGGVVGGDESELKRGRFGGTEEGVAGGQRERSEGQEGGKENGTGDEQGEILRETGLGSWSAVRGATLRIIGQEGARSSTEG
jgi:hypothetical protein